MNTQQQSQAPIPAAALSPDPDAGRFGSLTARKRAYKDALVALSLANLCLVSAWFSPLYDADLGYYNKSPVTKQALLALATNIIGLALLGWLAAFALRRLKGKWLTLPGHFLFF